MQKLHSIETALVQIMTDVSIELDSRNIVQGWLLDLCTDFDTVGYDILFRRREVSYAFDGKIMAWLDSYLSQ